MPAWCRRCGRCSTVRNKRSWSGPSRSPAGHRRSPEERPTAVMCALESCNARETEAATKLVVYEVSRMSGPRRHKALIQRQPPAPRSSSGMRGACVRRLGTRRARAGVLSCCASARVERRGSSAWKRGKAWQARTAQRQVSAPRRPPQNGRCRGARVEPCRKMRGARVEARWYENGRGRGWTRHGLSCAVGRMLGGMKEEGPQESASTMTSRTATTRL